MSTEINIKSGGSFQRMIKFSEIHYSRPDTALLVEKINSLTEDFKSAKSFDETLFIFNNLEKIQDNVETMYSTAYTRHMIDTKDEFYDGEMRYLDEKLPLLQEAMQTFSLAFFDSPFRNDFEKSYGSLIFKKIEISLKTFSPEIITELQEENKLVTDYSKLIASAQIDFDGEKRTLSQLSPYKLSADDEVREAAWNAEGQFYADNADKLDNLYDDLVKLRDTQAKKIGYENYIPLGYNKMSRESYDKKDVELFRKSVRDHLVPVADRLYRAQAKRLGVSYPLTFADAALSFRTGNPKPQGTSDDILAHAKKFYHELSPETAEFIDALYDGEYFDVLSKKGKAGGGYCTFLPDCRMPFIFANFNGTSHDVDVMTHEAGHAFAFYMSRDFYPSVYRQPTNESCEVHSMSMEFLAWDWAEGFFGKDTNKYKYHHISAALTFIPYGTMVDHFQHIVYENPEMTPAMRHEEWKKLLAIYMPWMKLGEITFYGEGKGWQRQSHIYQRPFYYIDYCLAQTVALQCWADMQSSRDKAWEKYLHFVKNAGKLTFSELVVDAGFELPFGDVFGGSLVKTVTDWIDNFEKSVELK